MAFILTAATGVIALRNESTPELDSAKRYPLGGQQRLIVLQPGSKR